jgi:hypothetical protein
MQKHFTSNDLVRLLYSETSVQEQLAMEWAIEEDAQSKQEHETLVAAKGILDGTLLSPSKSTLASILSYSRQTALETA